jgi:hypothetical protein
MLVHICINAIQFEVGTFEPFMFLRHPIHGHTTLTTSGMHGIWTFIELFQGTTTLSNNWTPSPQRQHDQSITSLTTLFTNIKGELQHINMYHIFFHAISISDITEFDGTCLTQKAYDAIRSDNHPTIRWPNQQRPTKGGWRVWQRLLLSISDNNRYLLQPLCQWYDASTWHHLGEWFTSTTNRTLMNKVGKQWFDYRASQLQRHRVGVMEILATGI